MWGVGEAGPDLPVTTKPMNITLVLTPMVGSRPRLDGPLIPDQAFANF